MQGVIQCWKTPCLKRGLPYCGYRRVQFPKKKDPNWSQFNLEKGPSITTTPCRVRHPMLGS